jgi:predicted TPR repeat methyltransferase
MAIIDKQDFVGQLPEPNPRTVIIRPSVNATTPATLLSQSPGGFMPEAPITGQHATTGELSLAEALHLAITLHQQNYLEGARQLYERILALVPEHADALHFLGLLLHQQGDAPRAIELIQQALALAPAYAEAHNNLGNIFREAERLEEALASYHRSIEFQPANPGAYNNLGVVLKSLGRYSEAEQAYRAALALAPDVSDFHKNLGHVLRRLGRVEEAIEQYWQAVLIDPDAAEAKWLLGTALSCLGRMEEATRVFGEWLEREPQNPVPRHLVAACSHQNIPTRAPDDYVRQVFDNFADNFDAKLQKLDYRAPGLVAALLGKVLATPAAALDMLDAGCGTGLCGPLLRPYARQLVGVDLSANMVDKARQRGVYDALEVGELTAHLAASEARWDAIVCADTLCYFGDLVPVMRAAAGALRPRGHLVFTVERAEPAQAEGGYHLNPSGRYSHTEDYLRTVLAEAGLRLLRLESDRLRMENTRPVAGWIALAERLT